MKIYVISEGSIKTLVIIGKKIITLLTVPKYVAFYNMYDEIFRMTLSSPRIAYFSRVYGEGEEKQTLGRRRLGERNSKQSVTLRCSVRWADM